MAIDTFNTIGDTNWVCPSGVTSVDVYCWGTGGNGGGGAGDYGSSGGGGGGYSRKNSITVIPGNSYAIHIGSAGGTVYFKDTGTVLANCGVSGITTGGSPSTAAGGVGGSVTGAVGDIKFAGGNGGSWDNTNGCGGSGGGSAGNGGAGGNGAAAAGFGTPGAGGTAGTGTPAGATGAAGSTVNGINGTVPGSGGSGCQNKFYGVGVGGAGQIQVEYTAVITSAGNMFMVM